MTYWINYRSNWNNSFYFGEGSAIPTNNILWMMHDVAQLVTHTCGFSVRAVVIFLGIHCKEGMLWNKCPKPAWPRL